MKNNQWMPFGQGNGYRMIHENDPLNDGAMCHMEIKWAKEKNNCKPWKCLFLPVASLGWRYQVEKSNNHYHSGVSYRFSCGVYIIKEFKQIIVVTKELVTQKEIDDFLNKIEDGVPFKNITQETPSMGTWSYEQSMLFHSLWEPSHDVFIQELWPETFSMQNDFIF